MTGHITPPQFDPHAEAIDGAPVDPWPADRRVKVARRANWFLGDDPNPAYSAHDNRDGLFTADIVLPTVDDSHNAPHRPLRVEPLIGERVIPEPPHSMFEAMRVLLWIVAIGVPAVVVFTVGFMVGRWVA